MRRTFYIFAACTALLLAYSLYAALVLAPTERTMGDVQRIFYYHAPSAWTAFVLFFINFLASIQFLVRDKPSTDRFAGWSVAVICVAVSVAAYLIRSLPGGIEPSAVASTAITLLVAYFLIHRFFDGPQTDMLALVTAEVGVVFCTIVLITGPLWARPVWGIWWTWDVRLTSTLVLWLIYVSYLLLRKLSTSGETPKLAAALAVFGALDMPLVYFSIWFFRTQHPQPVIGGGGSIDPRMLRVFALNCLAFTLYAAVICWFRFHVEQTRRGLEETLALEALLDTPNIR